MNRMLDPYGLGYRPMMSDAEDVDTRSVVNHMMRNQAYDQSTPGQFNAMLASAHASTPDAPTMRPTLPGTGMGNAGHVVNFLRNAIFEGAKTANHWLGAPQFPEKVQTGDVLAPLGAAGMAAPFTRLRTGAARGVVDEATAPQRLYHGTAAQNFTQFRDAPWLTPSPDVASYYAANMAPDYPLARTSRVYPVEMQADKPFHMPMKDGWPDYAGAWKAMGVEPPARGANHDDVVKDALRERGYDHIVFDGILDHGGSQRQYLPLKEGTVKSSTTGETLFADQARSSVPGTVVNALAEPQGIRAYHGSPHDFDKFDPAKIGSGDGTAQGHGFYFAGDPAEAKYVGDLVARGNPSRMYEVNLKTSDDRLLPWDTGFIPKDVIDRLPQDIRHHVLKDIQEFGLARQWSGMGDGQRDIIGRQLYQSISRHTKSDKETSHILKGLGFDGAKYSGLEGKSNSYVVFDDKLIDILRKYGLVPGAVTGGAALAGGSGESEARQ
jgi:hypothetical protein